MELSRGKKKGEEYNNWLCLFLYEIMCFIKGKISKKNQNITVVYFGTEFYFKNHKDTI